MIAGTYTARLSARHVITAAATLLLGALAPGAVTGQTGTQDWCNDVRSDRDQYCEIRELTLSPRDGRLAVDVGPNGSITVEGYSGSEVRVTARVVTRSRSAADAESMARDVEIMRNPGELRASGPRTRNRESWSVSVRMQVPTGTELDMRTTNGAIRVSGTHAPVSARTTNGSIRVDDVVSSIQAQSTNGTIRAAVSGRAGSLDAMSLRTTNGSIHLALPENASARIAASTTNGGINSDLPIRVQGNISRRSLNGILGEGGPEIKLSTTNGGIRITSN
jgi:hypothetical protein